ncbi:MAG: thiamine pyrophosphate-dependent enzyme [Candidatus Bathyarchaeia archaeon]
MIPSNALIRHETLLKRLDEAERISESTPFNRVVRDGGEVGIVTSGVSVNYSLEAVEKLDIAASVLKLGMTHPLPSKLVLDFIDKFEMIFIVEELEPILENAVRSIAFAGHKRPAILGKLTGHLPRSREYSTRIVVEGLAKGLGIETTRTTINGIAYTPSDIPGRPPVLCPGCPHRASFYLVKTSLGSKPVYCTDIGCYALGVQPPLAIGDVLICMGASVGLACGVSKAHDGPVLAVIGDSTFFHAAIPALIDAVNNDHRIIVTVLDNLTTAMTGFQPHPGSVDQNRRGSRVSVEEVAKGCGVKYVKVLDPYDVSEARRVLKEASNIPGPSVIVLRHLCCILETKKDGKKPVYRVDERCNGCRVCITIFGCPAMYLEGGAVKINSSLCNGCGFCVHVCPSKAIVRDRD